MQKRNWFYLFSTNFVGVFNDNFLKFAVIYVAVTWHLPTWMNQSQVISVLSAAMVIPYLLLTPLSGHLSQQYDKYKILKLCKWLELPIILIALLGFALQQIWIAASAVLLMGIQSCLYSPAKYGLIRDIGGKEGASFGSGVFEAMAFLGILIGTVAASVLSDHYHFYIMATISLLLVVLGIWFSSSIKVKELPPIKEHSSLNPIKFTIQLFKFCKGFKGLNLAVFGASMLWFLGGLLQMNLVIHTTRTLHSSNTDSGLLLAMAALGIALGTFAAGKISGRGIKPVLIYIGLGCLSLAVLSIIVFKPSYEFMFLPVFAIAFCGGLFEVPCLAMVQQSDTGRRLGDVVAYMNLIVFILVLLATALFSLVTELTAQNSYAVFGLMLGFSLFTLLLFIIHRKELFQ